MPNLKTKRGQLTVYGLACGYIEKFEHGGLRIELSHEGGPVYHVKGYDDRFSNRLFWETFTSIVEARRFYAMKARTIKQIFRP